MHNFRDYLGYFFFGLHLGVMNLLKNGFSLGIKKTFGKILQPINSFSRFPEYKCFFQAIGQALEVDRECKLLDIGSPKLFGLYLAYHFNVEIVLTDINGSFLQEYIQLWDCIENNSKGNISFQVMDAREIQYDDAVFDIVYSMSVIEHIDSDAGDAAAVKEMCRVVKNSGSLVLSVPVGSKFVVQERDEFSYTANGDDLKGMNFFQKIYDKAAIMKLLSQFINDMRIETICIQKRFCSFLGFFLKLGDNFRALLGFLSPAIALICCRVLPDSDIYEGSCEQYNHKSRGDDIYSDLVLIFKRLP